MHGPNDELERQSRAYIKQQQKQLEMIKGCEAKTNLFKQKQAKLKKEGGRFNTPTPSGKK